MTSLPRIEGGLVLHAETLGRLRSEFGDPPAGRYPEYARFRDQLDGSTHMFFPVGVADRRYYLHNVDPALVLETKKGTRIRVEWCVPLEMGSPLHDEAQLSKLGTLEAMLARSGYKPTKPVSRPVLACLRARKFFASYYLVHISEMLAAGYVDPAGNVNTLSVETMEHDTRYFDCTYDGRTWTFSYFQGKYPFPKTSFDYPVTKAERMELNKIRRAHDARLKQAVERRG